MKKTMLSFLAAALLLCLAVENAGAATRTIRVGCNGSEEHVHIIGLRLFEKILNEKSGGQMRVQVFPNSILGSEREMVEQTIMGSLEMAVATIDGTVAAWVPEGQLYSVPYLFADAAEARDATDNCILDLLQDKYQAVGLRNLAIMELGFRHFTNNKRPVKQASDMAGLLIRVQETASWQTLMNQLGCTAAPLAFNELYSAMQQGVIDGQENPMSTISSQKFYEVQKYLVLDSHTYSAGGVLMNLAFYNQLSDQERAWLEESIAEANAQQRAEVDRLLEEQLQMCRDAGMIIEENPDLDSFKQATAGFENVPAIQSLFDTSLVQRVREYLAAR